jgi:hypothetical protein
VVETELLRHFGICQGNPMSPKSILTAASAIRQQEQASDHGTAVEGNARFLCLDRPLALS